MELKLSDIFFENKSLRFDSTYFVKHSFLIDKSLRECPHFFLNDIEVVSGPFGSTLKSHAYLTTGVPFVRVQNIKGGFEIQKNEIIYISEEDNNKLKNSQLVIDDLVLSKVGNTIGYYARVDEELQQCNISENNIGIKLSAYPIVKRHYILTFLNSLYGKILTLRKISGNAQPKLNVSDISEIPIPQRSMLFETEISRLIVHSRKLKHYAMEILPQAETLLLNALGMADFLPSTENVNVKSFKESFLATGRLDAEYYQPKYDQLRDILESYFGGVMTIDELAGQITNGAEVREYQEKGVAYLRVGDLKNLTIEPSSVVRINPISAEKGIEKIGLQVGDVLVSRSGSLAVTAVIEPEWEDALISSHLIRLRIRDERIDPYYLALFLSATPGKMQIQQQSNGGVQPEINQPALKSILIPILPQSIQQEIRYMILSARKLRDSSSDLLTLAKRAVEIAIEQDEAAGMAYIEANIEG